MPFIRRPARPTLHYRIDDFTDPWKTAETIVLQHGYARSSRFWYGWIPHLARHYRVVRMDLRGHGESPVDFDPATESTLEDYVGDIAALLDELELGAVHYCGESFGGIIGMVLAAEQPERVRTLTLVASPVYQNANAATPPAFRTARRRCARWARRNGRRRSTARRISFRRIRTRACATGTWARSANATRKCCAGFMGW